MEKSSEGVVIHSLDSELQDLEKRLRKLTSLPKLARKQFVKDIQVAVGNLEDPYLPASLKPMLARLLNACSAYLDSGNEKTFIPLCKQAIELTSKGWGYLSYWTCSEQTLCYQIFWGLKDALAKHQKLLGMYDNCCNDGASRLQFYRLPLRKLST